MQVLVMLATQKHVKNAPQTLDPQPEISTLITPKPSTLNPMPKP